MIENSRVICAASESVYVYFQALQLRVFASTRTDYLLKIALVCCYCCIFRNENHNKLKYRVLLSNIWLTDCFDSIHWSPPHTYRADTSFVIGWPPATNFIADFKDNQLRDIWLVKLRELIATEKQKEDHSICLNIKICFNKDTLGGSEPTQYSQCFVNQLLNQF